MQCPVCNEPIRDAAAVLDGLDSRFAPCPDCGQASVDPRRPPGEPVERCRCGRRGLDGVMAAVHAILTDEGRLPASAPLAATGTPLLHPLFPMRRPPFLPERSLVLISRHVTPASARRLVTEVPEVRGVVLDRGIVPGVHGETHLLLAGCDVYAEARFPPAGPLVLYKQASTCHIEAPRPVDPKVTATEQALRRHLPDLFVDACSGVGTLGLVAALRMVPSVVLNDAWGPAAWFAGLNLSVNREALLVDEVEHLVGYAELREAGIRVETGLVTAAHGDQEVRVYHGSLWSLSPLLPTSGLRLAAVDPFEKAPGRTARLARRWQEIAGGEVFIP